MRLSYINCLLIVVMTACVPQLASAAAGNYTAPISATGSSGINSFFDHTSPTYAIDGTMTKYNGDQWTGFTATAGDCTIKVNCYDGHNGLDYNTQSVQGKPVLAAADGLVRESRWENPSSSSVGFGRYVRLWHSQYNQTTLYGHLAATSVKANASVIRSQKIGESGNSGNSTAPHLHFSVYNGDTSATSYSSSIDPDGWLGSGQDPWTLDKGYLWAVSSTSLALYTAVSGDISSSTTWLPGVYVINGTVNITSGARLNINRDAVIKFQTSASKLVVANGGILDAEGTASSYIYFTSYKDDYVGGDTNGDTTSTTPAAGDWDAIQINIGASSTLSYAVIRYGGSGTIPTNIYAAGGSLQLLHSEIATGTTSGIYAAGTSTITIVSSNVHHFSDIHGQGYGMKTSSTPVVTASSTNFHDNLLEGIHLTGTSPTLTLTGNQFSNNTTAAVSVDLSSGPTFTHSGNTASGTGYRGFLMSSEVANNETWTGGDLPYVISQSFAVSVPSGITLTINPGAVVKFEGAAANLAVSGGNLKALGTGISSVSSVYFTSLNDDATGDDANGNGTTSGAAGDWDTIRIDSGSSTFTYAFIRFGGNTGGGRPRTDFYVDGGTANLTHSEVASSTTDGIKETSGTTVINSSTIHGNVSHGVINVSGVSLNAQGNYWGASDGPGPVAAGAGDHVSADVDYSGFLSSWP